MNAAAEAKEQLGCDWLPAIYAEKVRSQRTRRIVLDIPERENAAEIHHTLLGIELTVGKRRFACPDLAAARYMRVFARVGCREFAIPYDITKVSPLADELETAWHKMLLAADIPGSARLRSALIKQVRSELGDIGPGDAMPSFDKPTRQRTG
jgi:hypothetical protein